MSLDNLLRDYARHELDRHCPPAHYWLRDHDPRADHELVAPLLHEPMRHGLTPKEHRAAQALADMATYQLRSREIWTAAYPARDAGDLSPSHGTTPDQEREIWARREVFRRSALIFARMLDDKQLIEHFEMATPPPSESETAAPVRPVPRSTAQEAAILQILAQLGIDPQSVPRGRGGKSGGKSAVRELASEMPGIFTDSSFEKTWERLRRTGALKDAAD